jgi:arylsulfatase A-like enzyme
MPPSFDEVDVSDKPARIRSLSRIRTPGRERIAQDYRCRRESVLAVDEGVRSILRQLDRSRELRNTIVVFTSDNGFFQGEHRIRQGKSRVYEEASRVPLLIRGPGVPRGRRVRGLTANIDLARTIARAARARSGRVLDGISLISAARRPRSLNGRAVLLENGPGADGLHFTAIRVAGYVYAEYDNGDRELYDLARDPFQLQSRHADPAYAGIRGRLAARLAALRTCRGSSCRR